MTTEIRINLLDLTSCISDAVDLIAKPLANHHRQVAYIGYHLGKELGFRLDRQNKVLLAGSLHDIGALSLRDKLHMLKFEASNPHEHSMLGYCLLKMFDPFSEVASIVRMHHVPWDNGDGQVFQGVEVPFESHILHLADRIAILVKQGQEILSQVERISEVIDSQSGSKFSPEIVEAFHALAGRESFWFDLASISPENTQINDIYSSEVAVTLDETMSLVELFAHIIDFRSRFTATHSSGIAASAEAIASIMNFSSDDRKMMRMAGHLHDLGKLAVPNEILEKPARLTEEEYRVVRKHPYLTYRLLHRVEGLETIKTWAALHHERLDGTGYPFHLKKEELHIGSRIMAVADVFTAITEDRPYRKGMSETDALKTLQQMVQQSALDGDIVSILKENYNEINGLRTSAQKAALETYAGFFEGFQQECA
jgi:HD-GYP domain-containing protein (c-di-GMP phosphodiesterase class II)